MKPIILFALLCMQLPALAQNKNLETKYAIKVYNQSNYLSATRLLSQDSLLTSSVTENSLDLFHPTLAFRLKTRRNNFHEIELTTLALNRQESNLKSRQTGTTKPVGMIGVKSTRVDLMLRYEYIINFCKKQKSRWMPSLGIAASPYLSYNSHRPLQTTRFAAQGWQIGLATFLIPRISYQINHRFVADLNFPITIADIRYTTDRIDDPNLPLEAQRRNVTDGDLFPPSLNMRIGLGISL